MGMTQYLRNGGRMAAVVVALSCVACGQRAPETPEARRERGEALIKKMSDRLGAAKSISVTTSEEIVRITNTGERKVERFTRELKLRRPNRLYSKTTGDRDLETFYEGERLTVVAHGHKVFGEFETPPTIDDTVDVITHRYGIALPMGDLLTNNAHLALLSSDTRGGWAGRDNIDGTDCARLEWQHPRVDWKIWIPESGDPLPRRMHVVYTARRGKPDANITFKQWNVQAPISDDTFARRIPGDYEGIAVIQRAAAVIDPADPSATPTTGKR
jgi:hypothetical protein